MRSPLLVPLSLVCLLIAAPQMAAIAPVGFANVLTYVSGGYSVYSVTVADVNGDGKLDLVAANICQSYPCSNGSVSVLLGNGDGTFQSPVSYSSGGWAAYSVVVGDLNGDGKPDIVVVNECVSTNGQCVGKGLVGVLLGNGDGTFKSVVTYDTGGYGPLSVAIGDVNRDGRPDVLVANECATSCVSNDGSVAVLLGNGDGSLQPALQYDSGGVGTSSVIVADVNGDGKPDAVVTNLCPRCANGTVGVLMGKGDGTFKPVITYNSGGISATSVAVADVNGDGKADLLVANGGTVGVLLGNGDGTFKPVVAYSSGGGGALSVAVADLNGDGKPDLALASGYVQVLLGNGDGTFLTAVNFDPGYSIVSVAVADVNGDGKPDVVGASGLYSARIGVLLNTSGTGVLSSTILSFGDVLLGQTSTERRVSLKNVGTSQLTISSISTTGDFALATNYCSAGVKPGTHCDVYVTFTPRAIGGETGILSFVDNATNSPQTVSLSGVGVTALLTVTKLKCSPNPSHFGETVNLAATVSSTSGIPTGSVMFYDGATALGTVALTNGTAQLATSALSGGGRRSLFAKYSGDTSYLPSGSYFTQTVYRIVASLAISSSANPSYVGQTVTYSVVVSSPVSVPTGTITFKQGTTVLSTVPLVNGQASYQTSYAKSGTVPILVGYSGDQNYSSTNFFTLKQVIKQYPTSTGLSSSLNPSVYGQLITLTATVTSSGPTPTGTVTFKSGSTWLGTVALNASGVATLTNTNLPVGSNSVTASYNGDAANGKSVSAVLPQKVSQAVVGITLISSPNPSTFGKSVKFTATLTSNGGMPNGQPLVFSFNGTVLGTASVTNGKTTFFTAALPKGNDVVTASYAGNADFSAASASTTQTVN